MECTWAQLFSIDYGRVLQVDQRRRSELLRVPSPESKTPRSTFYRLEARGGGLRFELLVWKTTSGAHDGQINSAVHICEWASGAEKERTCDVPAEIINQKSNHIKKHSGYVTTVNGAKPRRAPGSPRPHFHNNN